ncbi:MAG: HEPN domain-containing protein [Thermoprotei archaeon]
MNFDDLAKSYLSQAEERLELARIEYERRKYNITVRFCQEAVELALKASLRLVGVEVPKFHDVGPVLKVNADRFPPWFKEKVDLYASYSRTLRREREPSMYGDEETGTPPELLYSEYDGREALRMATEVVQAVRKLLEEKERSQRGDALRL